MVERCAGKIQYVWLRRCIFRYNQNILEKEFLCYLYPIEFFCLTLFSFCIRVSQLWQCWVLSVIVHIRKYLGTFILLNECANSVSGREEDPSICYVCIEGRRVLGYEILHTDAYGGWGLNWSTVIKASRADILREGGSEQAKHLHWLLNVFTDAPNRVGVS